MNRRPIAIASGLVVVIAACSDLFGEAQQCTSDADCTRFAAVCDLGQGVCVPKAVTSEGTVPAPTTTNDAPPPPPEVVPTPPTDAGVVDSCPTGPKPVAEIPVRAIAGSDDVEIATSVQLDCTKDWRLKGRVFVRAGATLTVDANTTVRTERGSTLVVQRGARLVAIGRANAPVVFTSESATPAAGDWTGIFVLGSAPPEKPLELDPDPAFDYGGANADDSSGALAFVRVEYAERGFVFGGVGRKTSLDRIQVRKTSDNCFDFIGGTVDGKHLVCQAPGDESFEYSNGYQGRMQFLVGLGTPPESPEHHGVLVDGALLTAYNVTLCGMPAPPQSYGVVVRYGARIDLNDAIVSGWVAGTDVIESDQPPLEVRGSVFANNTFGLAFVEDQTTDPNSPTFDDDNGFDEIAWLRDPGRMNSEADPRLVACFDAKTPKPYPSTALTQGALKPPLDGFFDPSAQFRGAIRDGSDTWLTGRWLRFADD